MSAPHILAPVGTSTAAPPPLLQTQAPVGPTPTKLALPMSPEERHSKVAALMASGSVEDGFEAARIIGLCKRAKNDEVDRAQATEKQTKERYARIPSVVQACSGLDPGQVASYARLIFRAVESGVPGAFAYVSRTANNDEEVDAQYHRLMQAAIDAGDPGAMWTRAMTDSIPTACGKDDERCSAQVLAEALTLLEAAKLIIGRWPPEGRPDPIPTLVERLDRKQAGLSGQAIERGQALARDKMAALNR